MPRGSIPRWAGRWPGNSQAHFTAAAILQGLFQSNTYCIIRKTTDQPTKETQFKAFCTNSCDRRVVTVSRRKVKEINRLWRRSWCVNLTWQGQEFGEIKQKNLHFISDQISWGAQNIPQSSSALETCATKKYFEVTDLAVVCLDQTILSRECPLSYVMAKCMPSNRLLFCRLSGRVLSAIISASKQLYFSQLLINR